MNATGELIARARLICGERHVVTDPSVLVAYRSDGILRDGPLPLVAILPGTAPEVAGVVEACSATGIPFVVRGAGTGHSGSALPAAAAALIVLTRLRRILAATPSQVTVEAGFPAVRLPQPHAGAWFRAATGALAGAARTAGHTGTVGGWVAETRGSARLSTLDLVRPNGALVQLIAGRPGYDVVGAFPGSQGRAGIAVALTLEAICE